jgi:hypothetical protein
MYGLQEEEEEEEELVVPSVREPTRQVNYSIVKQSCGSASLLCVFEIYLFTLMRSQILVLTSLRILILIFIVVCDHWSILYRLSKSPF